MIGERRVLRDLVDVRDGGEVEHRIDALERLLHDRGIAEIAEHRLHVRVVRGRDQIEDPRFVARGVQLVDDVRADEPGAAGDEDLHCSSGR